MFLAHALRAVSTIILGAIALSTSACLGGAPEEPTDESPSTGETGAESAALDKAEPSCMSDVLGGLASCRSPEDLKQGALDLCEAKGLSLSGFRVQEECGDDLFASAAFSCCPSGADPAPAPAAVLSCSTRTLGEAGSCKEASTWKDAAVSLCTSAGMTLTNLDFGPACGDGSFELALVECCP